MSKLLELHRICSIFLQSVKQKFFLLLKWTNEPNLLEISSSLCVLLWMTMFILSLCEPGARMINALQMFSEELCRCDWFLLPVQMQRMYMVFLLDTQHPIKIKSYGNLTCERETSKQVFACGMCVHSNCQICQLLFSDDQQSFFIFYDDSSIQNIISINSAFLKICGWMESQLCKLMDILLSCVIHKFIETNDCIISIFNYHCKKCYRSPAYYIGHRCSREYFQLIA